MSLIGPTPTVASVSSLVRSAPESQLEEIFDEVVQYTDGPILTNLAANQLTRAKLVDYLGTDKLKKKFSLLRDISDPKFVALSWLADEVESLKQPILDLIAESPVQKSSLTVYIRLLTKGKLDLPNFDEKLLDELCSWLRVVPPETKDRDAYHWQTLATLLVKALVPSHTPHFKSKVAELLKDGNDEKKEAVAYALLRTVCDEVPEIVSSLWDVKILKESDDFFSMVSTISNNKDNREKAQKLFSDAVSIASDGGNVFAAVANAKFLAGTTTQTGDIDTAAKKLDKLSQEVFETNVNDVTLEGLACTSLLNTVRNRIAQQPSSTNASLIPQLVVWLKANPTTAGYAVLAILVNLARYPIKPTQKEQQNSQLRRQALGLTVFDLQADEDVKDESAKLKARQESGKIFDQIMTASLLSWTVSNATKFSVAAHKQLAYLLRELAAHQEKHRREKLASQGSVILAIYLWTVDKPHKLEPHVQSAAAATIAKVLATVEPRAALTAKLMNTALVVPLCEQIENEHSDRPNLDTFEALRALTNLSSLDDSKLRLVISKYAWPKMTAALNSEFVHIRRASLELICNLMMVSTSVEHFLQPTAESDALLSLLGQSVVCDDEDSRLAAAGALAILAEWDMAAERIGHNVDCVEGLTKSMGLFPDNDPLLLRVLSALNTIIKATTDELDDEVVETIVFNEGLTHLEGLVETLDPLFHKEVGSLVLQCIKRIAEYKKRNPTST